MSAAVAVSNSCVCVCVLSVVLLHCFTALLVSRRSLRTHVHHVFSPCFRQLAGKSDPYLRIQVGEELTKNPVQTRVVKGTLNPIWTQHLELLVKPEQLESEVGTRAVILIRVRVAKERLLAYTACNASLRCNSFRMWGFELRQQLPQIAVNMMIATRIVITTNVVLDQYSHAQITVPSIVIIIIIFIVVFIMTITTIIAIVLSSNTATTTAATTITATT